MHKNISCAFNASLDYNIAYGAKDRGKILCELAADPPLAILKNHGKMIYIRTYAEKINM